MTRTVLTATGQRLANRARLTGRQVAVALGDTRRAIHWRLGGRSRLERLLSEQRTWIFIVGCNNSGSSLLQRLFALTGHAATMRFEGQKHSRVLPRATRRGYNRIWSEYAPDLGVAPDMAPVLGPRLAHDWLTSLTGGPSTHAVEKTPANVLRMPFLQACFPDCAFIGLVRNGYAVAEGIRRKAGHSLRRAAAHWAWVQRVMREEARNVDRFLTIRYEDLTDDYARCTEAIADFVDLPREAFQGLDERFFRMETVHGRKAQPLRNMNHHSLTRLNAEGLSLIEEAAGPELLAHGYTRPDSSRGGDTEEPCAGPM